MKRWKFIKTNLWRDSDSGNYFARVMVKGRDVWRSVETDLRGVADSLLPSMIARIRANAGAVRKSGSLTLGACAEIYMDRRRERGYRRKNQASFKPLKPRSIQYREETLAALKALWPDFDKQSAALISAAECHTIADKVRRRYRATRFNGIVQTMRGLFEVAMELGVRNDNPAAGVAFAEVPAGNKPVPTREQVTEIWRLLDNHPKRRFARLSVRGLAFTGLRPNEARHLKAADVNLKSGTLTARETKNGKPRTIQLIAQAMELFQDEGVARVLAAMKKNPRRTLATIGKRIGIDLTPYTMRHLHMSVLVESGIDVPTAAMIAGHGDRGVTLLRHYTHARSDHVRKQLQKVVI